jgi:SAM-dependent methyltransferase
MSRFFSSSRSERGDWRDWEWDETLFAGAAEHYERGRPPYAPGLADAMADALDLDGTGRLLDVGCGPGSIALRLAHLFDEVVGVDADAGMVAEAERLAHERSVTNARFTRMRGEDLPGGLGMFRAVTFAASLHWMDRLLVFSTVRGMLDLGGAVVHIGNPGYGGTRMDRELPHPPPPDDAITELRVSYLGPDRRAGRGIRNSSPDDEDDIFCASGFTGPEIVVVPDDRVISRTIDDVVASNFSSSASAPHLFGDRLEDFESELRELLARSSSEGLFSVALSDNILKVWRPSG